jgi:transglutaminase-like putative cysteine protease
MSAAAAAGRAGPVPRVAAGPLLPLGVARGAAFFALAVFGSLHWMTMLEPAVPGRAWWAVGTSLLAVLVLLGAGRLAQRFRPLAGAAVAVLLAAMSLLAAGVGDEFLAPGGWGELASGVGRGIEAIPGARVPYRGLDEWTRTVITLGGTGLVSLAALLAFWPRRARTGFPMAALFALVALYATPAVALDFESEFLRGALLTVLMLAFLRLEKLGVRELPAAGGLAGVAAVLALMVAPALDRDQPWWDYETWALSTAASKSTTFTWDHEYGPLDWPRDGRELLRVKARLGSYWKADNLDLFDGQRWRHMSSGFVGNAAPETWLPERYEKLRWTQRIKVSVRNLRTDTFVTAGTAIDVEIPGRSEIPSDVATIWRSARTLKRGDAYTANVYTPRPGQRLDNASTDYSDALRQYLRFALPTVGRGEDSLQGDTKTVEVPSWGSSGEPMAWTDRTEDTDEPAELLIERSELKGIWQLSQTLRRRARNPRDYVREVENWLSNGFTYSESPPRSASTLHGFLFDAKSGYCQQFSGAMALLLRMGGVPARVATGFTPGSYDERAKEYVVRDLDAHSWVEAWFPGFGWVLFDPTPASAPPRSQGERGGVSSVSPGDLPDFGGRGDRTDDPRTALAQTEERGTNWTRNGILAGLAIAVLAFGLVRLRRRRAHRQPGPVLALRELERALRLTGFLLRPDNTLRSIEAGLKRSPAAAGYVRALRDQRYRPSASGPTPAQRRGLRAELARGRGIGGRLRAWWALPPRMP